MKWARGEEEEGILPCRKVTSAYGKPQRPADAMEKFNPTDPVTTVSHLPVSMPSPTRLPDAFCMAGVCSMVNLACCLFVVGVGV